MHISPVITILPIGLDGVYLIFTVFRICYWQTIIGITFNFKHCNIICNILKPTTLNCKDLLKKGSGSILIFYVKTDQNKGDSE